MITLNVLDKDGNPIVTHPIDGSVVEPLLTALLASPSLYASFGTVTNANAKSAAGKLLAVRVTNTNAAARYLQVFNKATAPTAGTDTPVYSFPIPAGSAASPGVLHLDKGFFGAGGANFTTGISFAFSTTLAAYTNAATAGDHTAYLHYV